MKDRSHLKIYSEKIIDPFTEVHFAWHKSLNDITIEHTHNFYEIFLITKGKVVHNINDNKQLLEEGTLVFIRPSDVHHYKKYKDENCELINIAFPQKTIKELFNYLGEGFNRKSLLENGMPHSVKLSNVETGIIIKRMEDLNLINRDSKQEINTKLRILLLEIFIKYFSSNYNDEKTNVPRWLSTLREEMLKKENFIKGFSEMQRISNKSKEHVCREFKKHFELTPTEFINDQRLNYAANLLTNTDENIPFISMEAGFENLSHFYHIFKKKYNSSPGDFRNKYRKSIIP